MNALHALLAYAAWTFALVLVVFLYRGIRFLTGTPINAWPRGRVNEADAPFVTRVADSHANCLENLPLFAVLVLVAAAMGKLALIDGVAVCAVYARVGQTLAHLSGTGQVNVLVRATFWAAQLAVFGLMGWRLFMA
jgi:uncharacterized MAPEG superfamily protein